VLVVKRLHDGRADATRSDDEDAHANEANRAWT
jgi:hypothetical protein